MSRHLYLGCRGFPPTASAFPSTGVFQRPQELSPSEHDSAQGSTLLHKVQNSSLGSIRYHRP